VRELIYTASRSRLDMLVLVITMIATVALDLISALAIGLLLYLVLRRTRLSYLTPVIDSEETLGD
jgi:MFS superfamily sulfate permease-like transporter